MKIAFDLRRIENAGVGRYMRCIVSSVLEIAPHNEYVFIMAPGTEQFFPPHSQVTVVTTRAKYYSFAEQYVLPRILKQYKVDILHAMHFVVPVFKVCPTIVTIHDTIHLVYPQDIDSRLGRIYSRWMLKIAARVSDKIVTVSEFSKSDICRYLGVHPDRVCVTQLGAEKQFERIEDHKRLQAVRDRYGISDRYILYTGIYKQRKNHDALLKAISQLKEDGIKIQLVIAGNLKEGKIILQEMARTLNLESQLVLTGFVAEEDLPALYSAACAYVCPSLYEGFGLTLLEAMSCGIPVIAHKGTSLPEVCGEAAVYVDASIPSELASAIRTVVKNAQIQQQLVEKGYRNLERFSFEQAAHRTLNMYDELTKNS